MHNGVITAETGLGKVDREPGQALRAVIVYDDITAGKHAVQLLRNMARSLEADDEIQTIPWSFNLLAGEAWRELAAEDVVKTAILIIATSGLTPCPPAISAWLESSISQLRGTDAAIVSLQSPAENPQGGGPVCHETIQTAARQAGLAWFGTVMQLNHEELCQRMQQRAEMVPPVPDKILNQQTSRHVMGENN